MRRYDIDALRVIALLLLILYHLELNFLPDDEMMATGARVRELNWLWVALQALNIWRIPILFFIAGMAIYFSTQRRGIADLLKDRTIRILIPLVFGTFVIVPLSYWPFSLGSDEPFGYYPAPDHLWFLTWIFIYAVVTVPLVYYFIKRPDNPIRRAVSRLLRLPLGALLVLAPLLIAQALIINPPIYPFFVALDVMFTAEIGMSFEGFFGQLHGVTVGLICFTLGYLFMNSQKEFFDSVRRYWPVSLAIAGAIYGARIVFFPEQAVLAEEGTRLYSVLVAVEASNWMLAAFGLGASYLNRPSRTFAYLSAAVFPVYILHAPMEFLLVALVFEYSTLPVLLEFVLIYIGILAACFALYEVIKRIKYARPLFGLKYHSAKPVTRAPAAPET